MAVQIQIRRDTAADWTSANPILAQGELGLEIDTARFKIGDGVLAWNSLLYANQVFSGPGAISANSSTAALRITQIGSGPALLVEDSASPDATPFVVDAAGNVGIGTSSPGELLHTSVDGRNFARIQRNSTDAISAVVQLVKQRGTGASPTIVASGDDIGFLRFDAFDGATLRTAAQIQGSVDGTPGSGDMPGRLVFSTTADGASTPTERMRITQAGNVGIGATSPGEKVEVAGNVKLNTGKLLVNRSNATDSTTAGGIDFQVDGTTYSRIIQPAAQALAVETAGTERMRITSAGNVGIGTSSPAGLLHVATDAATAVFADAYGTGAATRIIGRRARGTTASPSAIQANDEILRVVGRGHDGTAFNNNDRAAMLFYASENHTSGAQGTQLTLWTTPNGTTTLTERMRIDNAGLITGTGTSLGAWTAYTPTLGGTGWAIGNGTVNGSYMQIGKLVVANVRIVWGSTSTFGAGVLTLTLPVTAATAQARNTIASGDCLDASASAIYQVRPRLASTSTVQITTFASPITYVQDTVPFTWASTDHLALAISYEIA